MEFLAGPVTSQKNAHKDLKGVAVRRAALGSCASGMSDTPFPGNG
jgi:hypothetical protein